MNMTRARMLAMADEMAKSEAEQRWRDAAMQQMAHLERRCERLEVQLEHVTEELELQMGLRLDVRDGQ